MPASVQAPHRGQAAAGGPEMSVCIRRLHRGFHGTSKGHLLPVAPRAECGWTGPPIGFSKPQTLRTAVALWRYDNTGKATKLVHGAGSTPLLGGTVQLLHGIVDHQGGEEHNTGWILLV